MPLRSLVQKEAEDRNLEFYPNHNTPSTAGGFNYGNSRTPIFEGQFRQRKYKFGDAGPQQTFDRPGEGYSREPLIGRNIDLPGVEEQQGYMLFIEMFLVVINSAVALYALKQILPFKNDFIKLLILGIV